MYPCVPGTSKYVLVSLSHHTVIMHTYMRSLPSAIYDALDTLYEPNAVFSQFLRGSASIDIFFSFPFLASSSGLLFYCFSCLFFSFLSFFVCFDFMSFLSFPLSSFLFFVSFFQFDLRLSSVCVVIGTTCNIYVVVNLGWQAA